MVMVQDKVKKTHQINKDWTKKLKELDIKDIQEPNIVEYLELKSANIEYDISQAECLLYNSM